MKTASTEREAIVAWHEHLAQTNRNLANMGLPAVSPTIAREKARWHEEAAAAINRGDHLKDQDHGRA